MVSSSIAGQAPRSHEDRASIRDPAGGRDADSGLRLGVGRTNDKASGRRMSGG